VTGGQPGQPCGTMSLVSDTNRAPMSGSGFQGRDIDPRQPSAARMYHYFLSGEAVFDADRRHGDQLFEITPGADVVAHNNRAFLQRAVKYLSAQGIRQFLDIGSGLPTLGNTHEVARRAAPDSRVVYVDYDLEAVNQSHSLLAEQDALGSTAVLEADLRDPQSILNHPDTLRLIDFTRPVGLLIVAVWHFVPDSDRPLEVMAALRDRLPDGSYVAMSHASLADVTGTDIDTPTQDFENEYNHVVQDRLTMRDRAAFTRFFDGFDLVDPGVEYLPSWRPEHPVDTTDPFNRIGYAGVGFKRPAA
jgi:hypothetical protein